MGKSYILNSYVSSIGEVHIRIETKNYDGTNYKSIISQSRKVDVSIEGGKFVAKYSGVPAKIYLGYVGAGAIIPQPISTTTLSCYRKCNN